LRQSGGKKYRRIIHGRGFGEKKINPTVRKELSRAKKESHLPARRCEGNLRYLAKAFGGGGVRWKEGAPKKKKMARSEGHILGMDLLARREAKPSHKKESIVKRKFNELGKVNMEIRKNKHQTARQGV